MNVSLVSEFEYSSITTNIWKIIIILISVLICFLTAGGNVLVLLSFKINKKLRTTNNYFLISLAIADFIIGFTSMPISTIYFITEKWLLGPYICDLWLSLDYTVSNASVANLLLISFDRYFSITRPLTYRVNRTTKKVTILIGFSWFISTIIWTPFILFWPYFNGKRELKDDECKVQFLYKNKYLTLGTCFVAFYIPVTIICIIYYKIWVKTKKRQIELRNLQAETHPKIIVNGTGSKRTPQGWNAVRKKLSDIKKLQKDFIENLVDKEEEEDFDVNEISTISCDDSFKNKKQKYSIETSAYNDQLEFHNRQLNPKWYVRIKNSKRLNWFYYLSNRIFCCRKNNNLNKLTTQSIDYSKCKFYYRSNKTLNQDSNKINCKYCQNERDYSFYTIVIQLKQKQKTERSTILNENEQIENKIESEPFLDNNLIIRQYPGYSLKSASNENLNFNKNKLILNNVACQKSSLGRSKSFMSPNSNMRADNFSQSIDKIEIDRKNSCCNKTNQEQNESETKDRDVKTRMDEIKKKNMQRKKLEKKQDQKAAKTLSAILLAFIFTWTPYNINVVINTFCNNCLDRFEIWQSFAYWLCYMNSTINPVLYALCNASFRRTFKDIFSKFKFKQKKMRT